MDPKEILMYEQDKKQQFVSRVLKQYPSLLEKFRELKANPQNKLNNLIGVEILPMFEDHLRVKAVGIEIEFRFSIVTKEEHQFFGGISAFKVMNSEKDYRSEEHIQSFHYDRHGNFKIPESNSFSYLNLSDDGALQEIVVETLHTALQASARN